MSGTTRKGLTNIVAVFCVALSCGSPAIENKDMNHSIEQQSEQAVIAYLKLSDDKFGEAKEREAIITLGNKFDRIIKQTKVGEYDGHEFGEGYAMLYMYGPDANKLFDAIGDIVEEHPLHSGSYIIKRFGPPGAKEERKEL